MPTELQRLASKLHRFEIGDKVKFLVYPQRIWLKGRVACFHTGHLDLDRPLIESQVMLQIDAEDGQRYVLRKDQVVIIE